ncbi:unnamed protein product [Pneumocystis jirovecii]|uniref:DNA replication licensing factor MCM6 n=1 Tax=Pneumocystis jirovecii TaxID=42068 RepID=L0PFF7_PNEJI|nr:unnamed protein product [Pneumocystis jirovecii]
MEWSADRLMVCGRFFPFLMRGLHRLVERYEPAYYRSTISQTTNKSKVSTDKTFHLAFYGFPLVSKIRDLRADRIGKLSSVSGTVTRTSEVRPELSRATFVCEACRAVVTEVEQVFRYTEFLQPSQCPNEICRNQKSWRLNISQSSFVDWQKVRIQENNSEIPTGSMPRTLDVILRGEIVERVKAGDKCLFTGSLIVIPDISQLGLPGIRPEAMRNTRGSGRVRDGFSGRRAGDRGIDGRRREMIDLRKKRRNGIRGCVFDIGAIKGTEKSLELLFDLCIRDLGEIDLAKNFSYIFKLTRKHSGSLNDDIDIFEAANVLEKDIENIGPRFH